MSRKDQILEQLTTGSAICDDCLSLKCNIHPRQTINQACSSLQAVGRVTRGKSVCDGCGKLKITNTRAALLAAPFASTQTHDSTRFDVGQLVPSPEFIPIKAPGPLSDLIQRFVSHAVAGEIDIYNEFSLQHELGIFLRQQLPDYLVQFERNVSHFSSSGFRFTKRELDIAVFSRDKSELKYVVELKYPRNGQHPESIFSFCKDIAFVEELRMHGFCGAAVVIFADDRLFYSGPCDGIYGFFRGARTISGRIGKPTGAMREKEIVDIRGSYVLAWNEVRGSTRYACIEV